MKDKERYVIENFTKCGHICVWKLKGEALGFSDRFAVIHRFGHVKCVCCKGMWDPNENRDLIHLCEKAK